MFAQIWPWAQSSSSNLHSSISMHSPLTLRKPCGHLSAVNSNCWPAFKLFSWMFDFAKTLQPKSKKDHLGFRVQIVRIVPLFSNQLKKYQLIEHPKLCITTVTKKHSLNFIPDPSRSFVRPFENQVDFCFELGVYARNNVLLSYFQ